MRFSDGRERLEAAADVSSIQEGANDPTGTPRVACRPTPRRGPARRLRRQQHEHQPEHLDAGCYDPSGHHNVRTARAFAPCLFNWLARHGVLESDPAAPVRGPAYSQNRGKTPFLTAAVITPVR